MSKLFVFSIIGLIKSMKLNLDLNEASLLPVCSHTNSRRTPPALKVCSIPGDAKSSSRLLRLAELKAPETRESQGKSREPEVKLGGEEREKDAIRKEEMRKRMSPLQSAL